MAALTRSNIAYDLSISPHREAISYGDGSLVYVFSSDLYRKKFLEKQADHRAQIAKSLTNRFGFKVQVPLVADLKLYSTIEKRGFLLVANGVEVKCQEDLQLDGEKMTLQISAE